MESNASARRASRVVSALAVLLLGCGAAVRAAEQGSDQRPEGIKVHGHWTIEIRNPDGALVSRDEFENALNGGERVLAGLMGRLMSGPNWSVRLSNLGVEQPCAGQAGNPQPCLLVEPSDPIEPAPWFSKNLELIVPTGALGIPGLPLGTVELRGSITAVYSSPINQVQSLVLAPPTQGGAPFALFFSATQLATPRQVEPGQIIQVSVVFSFS